MECAHSTTRRHWQHCSPRVLLPPWVNEHTPGRAAGQDKPSPAGSPEANQVRQQGITQPSPVGLRHHHNGV